MPYIIIVCTANICRSPVAEAVLRQRLEAREKAAGSGIRWQVSSAGTWADYGQAASTYSVELMAEQGLDISGHGSQPVEQALMDDDCHLPGHTRDVPALSRSAHLAASAGDPAALRSGVDRPVGDATNAWTAPPGEWAEYAFDGPRRVVSFSI